MPINYSIVAKYSQLVFMKSNQAQGVSFLIQELYLQYAQNSNLSSNLHHKGQTNSDQLTLHLALSIARFDLSKCLISFCQK